MKQRGRLPLSAIIYLLCAGLLGSGSSAALALEAESYANKAVKDLSDYIKIDTTNPPGNEIHGAQFLAARLKEAGLEPQIFTTTEGRACVYARLKGNGKKKAVVLLNHIDVVPAKAADWQQPPFEGKIVQGEIWGRGALDMKSFGIAQLEAIIELKNEGADLDRDLIFLATADEEIGGHYGADWFVSQHPELIQDAEFLLNEGGYIDTDENGTARYWGVSVSEKSVLWLNLKTEGLAGHGSMPLPDSAPNRLIASLSRLAANLPAPEIVPSVREYFKLISQPTGKTLAVEFSDIDTAVRNPESLAKIMADRMKSAMLRNTVSLTVLKAGYKTNVIPAEAEAEIDCRLLPGWDKDKFIEDLRNRLGDSSIRISVLDWVNAGNSPFETDFFKALKTVANTEMPGVPVVPMVVPWCTDSHYFRAKGINSYGFAPFRIDDRHLATMHGKDERIEVSVYRQGVVLTYKIIKELCGAKN